MPVDANTLIQGGGLLAFATMVYVQLREQTKELRRLSAKMIKILERQDVIQANIEKLGGDKVKPRQSGLQRLPTPKPPHTAA